MVEAVDHTPGTRSSRWAHPAVPAFAVAASTVLLALTVAARPTPLVAAEAGFWALLGTAAGYAVSGSV